jgi:MFS family permease
MFERAYKGYVLFVLTLVYTLNFVDRNLMILLLQPIKEDLHLSDTQLGVLTGIAFGLFYATLGIPIARLADRGNRVSITSVAIGLWGLTVMGCMFVTTFVQLLFARVAAAVGESGCMPPTCSLLGDYFPEPAERARSMAIYWLGAPVSALISFVAGGWLNALYGWRMTFLVMGAPALLVAVLVKTTVAEPRNPLGSPRQVDRTQPGLTDVLKVLWRQPSARNLGIGVVLYFMLGLGLGPWYAAFMIRNHGMGTAELGTWLGLIWSVCGVAGLLLGGHAASRWFAGDERAQMRSSAAMVGSLALFYVLFLLLPGKHAALATLVPLALASNFFFGPTFALLQRLVPAEMRATALAVVMLLANLIGMGVGPELVGILSDRFQPVLGIDSLRYAMLIMSLVALWAAHHFWQVGRTVATDLRAIAAEA